MLKLIVKSYPSGKQYVIEADIKDTIKDFKVQVAGREGVKPENVSLKWQQTDLLDDQNFQQHGIGNHFTINAHIERDYYGRDWVNRLSPQIQQSLFNNGFNYPEPLLQDTVLAHIFDQHKLKRSRAVLINDQLSAGKTTLLTILALQSLDEIANPTNLLGQQQPKSEAIKDLKQIFILTENKDEIQQILKKIAPQQLQPLIEKHLYLGNLEDFNKDLKSSQFFFQDIKFFGADNIEQIYRNSGDKSKLLSILGLLSYNFQGGGMLDLPKVGQLPSTLLASTQNVRVILTDKVFSSDFQNLLTILFKAQNMQYLGLKNIGPDQTFSYINTLADSKEEVLLQNIADFLKAIQLENLEQSFSIRILYNQKEISTRNFQKLLKDQLQNISFLVKTEGKDAIVSVIQRGTKNRNPVNESNPILVLNICNLQELSKKERYSERKAFINNILWNDQSDLQKKMLQQINLNIFFQLQQNEKTLEKFEKQMQAEYHWFSAKKESFIGEKFDLKQVKNSPILSFFSDYIHYNISIQKQLLLMKRETQKESLLGLAKTNDPNALADALIKGALGGGSSANSSELKREYEDKIEKIDEFDQQTKQLLRQRLGSMSSTTEGEKIKNYFQVVFSIPWGTYVEDNLKLKEAEDVLNSKHYGMQKAKDAILNFLAVLQHVKQQKEKEQASKDGEEKAEESQNKAQPPNVICLLGAPGVGKTSLVEVVADCLHRDCVKIALGGVNNVTFLRGHNYTYVGAKAGAVASAFQRSKSMNPVILLDEIDKISGSSGDSSGGQVASALLEILDPSQNDKFMDHYLDFPINLSQALFICTANDMSTIPGPLRDRMKIIQVPSYSKKEKIHIANNYVIPKILKTCKLDKSYIEFEDEAIEYMIMNFSPQESGIRKLQEMITEISQKTVNDIIKCQEGDIPFKKQLINQEEITKIFGMPYIEYDIKNLVKRHGAVVGLATNPSVGGSVKVFESCIYRGKGQLIITSDVGKILQASIQIGIGWVKCNEEYLIEKFSEKSKKLKANLEKFIDDRLNLNFNFSPATPIDGPSAGIALFVALISTLTEIQLPPTIALTGEITLHGVVTAVGGIKQKVSAAIEKGIERVVLSKQNEKQVMEDLTNEQRAKIKFHFVDNVEDVIDKVFFYEQN